MEKQSVSPNLGESVFRCSFIIVIFVEWRYYIASPSLTWMGKILSPNITKTPPLSSESWLCFTLRSTWPRGLCFIKFPHPWWNSSTLLHPLYNPPGWPGGLPRGKPMTCALLIDYLMIIHRLVIHYLKDVNMYVTVKKFFYRSQCCFVTLRSVTLCFP